MSKPKPVRNYRPADAKTTRSRQVSPEPETEVTAVGWRGKLERSSAGALMRLSQLPTWVPPLLLLIVVLAGLLIPANWAGVFLILAGLFLTWLAALSWPTTSLAGRVLRVFANAFVIAVGVAKILGLLGS